MKIKSMADLEAYFSGLEDCESGKPAQSTDYWYECGYSTKYWQIEAAAIRSDRIKAGESKRA